MKALVYTGANHVEFHEHPAPLPANDEVLVKVGADPGPYVPGRIVDVSHSAADALGMVGSGIAKVKLDVVQ